MGKRYVWVILLTMGLMVGTTGSAMGFSSMVVLGDSLSDNGNTLPNLTDPYGVARFTDGPIWVEIVADTLGATLFDGAFGGATTGMDNPAAGSSDLGLQWQVDNVVPAYLPAIDSGDTLFSVWAGANDFFQGRNPFTAAANIGTALDALWAVGARDIIVPNLPNLGLTPGFYNDVNPAATAAQAAGWTMAFNGALAAELAGFNIERPEVTVYALDNFAIFNSLIPVDANGTILDPQFWASLFWDPVHPSTIGHQRIAEAALSAIPEPATLVLLITGMVGLGWTGRRRSR